MLIWLISAGWSLRNVITNSIFESFLTNPVYLSSQNTISKHTDFLDDSTVITKCVFTKCSAYQGGGCLIDSAQVSVESTMFIDCTASVAGSMAILAPVRCSVSDVTVKGGYANVVCGGVMIDSSTIHENPHKIRTTNLTDIVAASAAALDVWDGLPQIEFCIVKDNHAFHTYGCVRTSSYKPHEAKITSCEFRNCSCVGEGGAIYAYWYNTKLTIDKCTFRKNSSGKNGRSLFIGNNKIDVHIKSSSFDGDRTVEVSASRGAISSAADSTNRFGVE